jgi:hypothetical protein
VGGSKPRPRAGGYGERVALYAESSGGELPQATLRALNRRRRNPSSSELARLHLPGANWLGIAIFATYLVPPSLLFIPLTR